MKDIIDIGQWKPRQVGMIARELLNKISRKADWEWRVIDESHLDPLERFGFVTLQGRSQRFQIAFDIHLDDELGLLNPNIPFVMTFMMKDGQQYGSKDLDRVVGLQRLETKCREIARTVQTRQNRISSRKEKADSRHQVQKLLTSLRTE